MARSRSRSDSRERTSSRSRRRTRDDSREREHKHNTSSSSRHRRDSKERSDHDRDRHRRDSRERSDKSDHDRDRNRRDNSRDRSDRSDHDRKRSDRDRTDDRDRRDRKRHRSRSQSPQRESRDKIKKEPREKQVKREPTSSSQSTSQSSQPSNEATTGFVWAKRAEQPVKTIDFAAELETVRQRRAARAEEVANLAKIREESERTRLAQSEAGGTMREEEFHRKQIFSRAKIRSEQGRTRPIDQLANNLLVDNSQLGDPTIVDTSASRSARLTDPLALIASLNQLDLQELVQEIEQYLEVSSNEHSRYWWSIQCLCRGELRTFDENAAQADASLSASVIADIHTMIDAIQSQEEVDDMKQQIASNTTSTPYWECVKHELEMHECRLYLTQHFRQLLQARLESLRQQLAIHSGTPQLSIQTSHNDDSKSDTHASLSPRLFHPDEILDVEVVDPIDDWRALDSARMEVMERFGTQGNSHEHVMNVSAQLTGAHAGRFKGRKPRFYNRVKTGFDWNRYNQAHYDRDNPPPKLVQGYKFTIFYPDLVEPNKAPKYSIEPDFQDDSSFCILRFVSGPPYEDLAFRIVNKDWEIAPRRGFKSSFDKGVLQLHFNFKRIFYRR